MQQRFETLNVEKEDKENRDNNFVEETPAFHEDELKP